MALGSTQPLKEMGTGNISWGGGCIGGRWVRLTTLPPSCAVVTKSGSLNLLEPSGPVQVCNGNALHFYLAINMRPITDDQNFFYQHRYENYGSHNFQIIHHSDEKDLSDLYRSNWTDEIPRPKTFVTETTKTKTTPWHAIKIRRHIKMSKR
jgi:hypothetical protein